VRDRWCWLAFLCSAGATLAAHATDPRVVVGPTWLHTTPDPDRWEVRTAGGTVHTSPGGVVLDTSGCPNACRAAIVLHVTLPDGAWRATVDLSREGALDRARLFAVDRRPDRSVAWYTGRNVAEGQGTTSVDLPPSLAGRPVEIGVVAIGTGGRLAVGRLDVVPTRISRLWLAWAVLAGVGWSSLAIASAVRIVFGVGGRARWIFVGLAALVVAGVLLPRPLAVPFLVQKVVGHAGAFAVLAAIGRSAGVSTPVLLVHLLAFAVATELVQLFRPDRSPSLSDIALDLLGACVGLLAVRIFRGARRALPASAASPP
jgi:hypothetical protein